MRRWCFLRKHFWIVPGFHIFQSQHQQWGASKRDHPMNTMMLGDSDILSPFPLLFPSRLQQLVSVFFSFLSFSLFFWLHVDQDQNEMNKTYVVVEGVPCSPVLGLQTSAVRSHSWHLLFQVATPLHTYTQALQLCLLHAVGKTAPCKM